MRILLTRMLLSVMYHFDNINFCLWCSWNHFLHSSTFSLYSLPIFSKKMIILYCLLGIFQGFEKATVHEIVSEFLSW